ncbi:MAG: MFS transporter [Bacteroidota bacterium]|nr:MFS transporter [Bacteroidota bacterium]
MAFFCDVYNRSGTMVIPFLTVYLTQKGYTLTEAGIVMACFGVGAMVGGYIGGKLTDRFGFYWVQVFSLLLNGLLFIILSYMQGLWQIAICIFFLASLGEAFRPANAAAIAFYSNDSNRTRCYSLNRLAINLGWAIGPAVGGILASINYNLLFWADGLTCITASMLLYFFLFGQKKTSQHQEENKETEIISSAYKDKIFLQGMFFLWLIGICFFQLFSMIPVFYRDEVHLSEIMIGWVLASNGLLIVLIEMVLVYKLENKRSDVVYMIYGTLLIGISFMLLAIAPFLALVLLSMFFVTFGEMLLFPFTNSFWVSRSSALNRGQYAALYTMVFALAQVVSPLLSSAIALNFGFTILFLFDFILCTIAAFGFIWLRKKIV